MNNKKTFPMLCLFIWTCVVSSVAQMPFGSLLPVDPKVKYGKLDNGLTYYIRHNELPKERAEFFIAQKVGSVLEQDNQAGLAHFLEHMAFNGSKNLPDKMMINYLEQIGVKFGENLNAYTSFDETVYNMSNVPVTRDGIIDTCLLVLHDWSGFISLKGEEIDKERGVIREEMRSRSHASFRQIEKLLPQIMPGSQYAKRMPIGTAEVIENFKHQELIDYYHKWYRPDLQGIVVVGDIDVDQVEAKIKSLFADIKKPVNPAERIWYPVPDNDEPIVGIVGDKEATSTNISIFFKHEPVPDEVKASEAGLVLSFFKAAVREMLSMRFKEITQKANPPFLSAYGGDREFIVAKTKDCLEFGATAKDGEVEKALKALTMEIERINRFGFTASEFERAKTDILEYYEMAFKEKDKQKNSTYTQEYVTHFLDGGAIPGIEMEYDILKQIAPSLTVDQINSTIKQIIGDKNIAIALTYPEKENVQPPTKEAILTWFNEARKTDVQAYEDKVSSEPLMKILPKKGKIVSTKKDDKFDATVFKLSNGVQVVVKPTAYKDDEICMGAVSPGGSSLFPTKEMTNIKLYSSVTTLGGVGNFSVVDLSKVLSGKRAYAAPTIGFAVEGFSGNSSVKDFETMLQLVYLYFTSPRMDQEAYDSFVGRVKSQLESAEVDPNNALRDTMTTVLYQNPARFARLRPADLNTLNYQTVMNWYKDRYKDAGDFTFIFVGNIHADTIKPLIETYLGALPATGRKESYNKNVNISMKTGTATSEFKNIVQNPKVTILDAFVGSMDYSLENNIKMSMLTQILNIVYTEKVREDEGGTYGVSVSGNIGVYPKVNTSLQIYYETNEDVKDKLNRIVFEELDNMANNGPRIEDFNKVKEFMIKKQKENKQENNFWLRSMLNFYEMGYDGCTNYDTVLNAVTPDDIKKFVGNILKQNNKKVLIMNGVKAE